MPDVIPDYSPTGSADDWVEKDAVKPTDILSGRVVQTITKAIFTFVIISRNARLSTWPQIIVHSRRRLLERLWILFYRVVLGSSGRPTPRTGRN
jgi:hypothetical protein